MTVLPDALVSVGFLMTAADYRSLCLAEMRRTAECRRVQGFRAAGAVLLVGGAVGAALLAHTLDHALIWGLCLAAGVFFSLYDPIVQPFLTVHRADRTYNRVGQSMAAQQMVFFPDRVEITTPQITGRYPYKLLHDVAETADAFLFVIGEGDLRILPKRVLDGAQTDRVRACLFPGK